jgi:hypothetical protein
VPPPEKDFDETNLETTWVRKVQKNLRDLATFCARTQPTQPLLVAFPPGLGAEGRATLAAEAKKQLGDTLEIRTHAQAFVAPPPETGVGKDFLVTSPWLCFVDNAGCLRRLTTLQGSKLRDEEGFLRVLRIFRDNGKPPRELPELVRETPTGPADPGKR